MNADAMMNSILENTCKNELTQIFTSIEEHVSTSFSQSLTSVEEELQREIEGLTKRNQEFLFNPDDIDSLEERCQVLCTNTEALEQQQRTTELSMHDQVKTIEEYRKKQLALSEKCNSMSVSLANKDVQTVDLSDIVEDAEKRLQQLKISVVSDQNDLNHIQTLAEEVLQVRKENERKSARIEEYQTKNFQLTSQKESLLAKKEKRDKRLLVARMEMEQSKEILETVESQLKEREAIQNDCQQRIQSIRERRAAKEMGRLGLGQQNESLRCSILEKKATLEKAKTKRLAVESRKGELVLRLQQKLKRHQQEEELVEKEAVRENLQQQLNTMKNTNATETRRNKLTSAIESGKQAFIAKKEERLLAIEQMQKLLEEKAKELKKSEQNRQNIIADAEKKVELSIQDIQRIENETMAKQKQIEWIRRQKESLVEEKKELLLKLKRLELERSQQVVEDTSRPTSQTINTSNTVVRKSSGTEVTFVRFASPIIQGNISTQRPPALIRTATTAVHNYTQIPVPARRPSLPFYSQKMVPPPPAFVAEKVADNLDDSLMINGDEEDSDDDFGLDLPMEHSTPPPSQLHHSSTNSNTNHGIDDSLMMSDGDSSGDEPFMQTLSENAPNNILDDSTICFNSDNFITSTPLPAKKVNRKKKTSESSDSDYNPSPVRKGQKATAKKPAPARKRGGGATQRGKRGRK